MTDDTMQAARVLLALRSRIQAAHNSTPEPKAGQKDTKRAKVKAARRQNRRRS